MGRSSGSKVMNGLIQIALVHIPSAKKRRTFYLDVIDLLESCDWDTHMNCLGEDKVYDKIINELYPDDDDPQVRTSLRRYLQQRRIRRRGRA